MGERGMHRDADRHAILVQDHPVGMARLDMVVTVMAFRPHPEKHHAARHALQHIEEVFGGHDRRGVIDVVVGPEQIAGDGTGKIDKVRVIDRDR